MPQTKYKLDRETLIKIGKGALIASTASIAIFLLEWLETIRIDNPGLVAFVAWFTPFATNFIREWIKGSPENTTEPII